MSTSIAQPFDVILSLHSRNLFWCALFLFFCFFQFLAVLLFRSTVSGHLRQLICTVYNSTARLIVWSYVRTILQLLSMLQTDAFVDLVYGIAVSRSNLLGSAHFYGIVSNFCDRAKVEKRRAREPKFKHDCIAAYRFNFNPLCAPRPVTRGFWGEF